MTDKHQRKSALDTRAVALVLFCAFLWGVGQVAIKASLTEIGPLWQAGLRSLGAAVLVALWAAWRGIPIWNNRDLSLRGGLLSGSLFAAEFACIFAGMQYTSASRMVVFIYMSPFVVALGMPFIAKSEKLNLRQIGGLVLAFSAVAWAFAEGFGHASGSPDQWIGDGLGLLSAVLWGCTTLSIRGTRLSSASAEKTLLYQLGISGILLTLAAVLTGEVAPAAWSLRLSALMFYQVVIVSFASYLVWFWMIRHYPATRLASFTLATPLFGLLAGALLLGEPITLRLCVALAALAVGVALVNKGQ